MAVDYLSAINKQGSGLNITQIVDSIVQAETAPIASRIQKNIDEKNAVISGYALIAAELDKMKDFANSTKGATAFSVNSDSTSVGVKVSDQSQQSIRCINFSEFACFFTNLNSLALPVKLRLITRTINIDFDHGVAPIFL